MKPVTPATLAFLEANRQFFQADLFHFAMVDGTNLYFTSANISLEYAGNLYLATGPFMERSKLRQSRGTSVDSLTLTCHASVAMSSPFFGGAGLPQALLEGALDGAYVTMSRLFFSSWNNPTPMAGNCQLLGCPFLWNTPAAAVILFYGRVADISSVGYSKIQIQVKSFLELLDMYYPWQLYQQACSWALFDANCQANPANFVQGGVVAASPGNTALSFLTNLTNPDGWFTLGRLQMTSGACAGQLRSIKLYQGSAITLMVPFVGGPPAAGDGFQAWAGCDRQLGTCASKFNNIMNFGGQPFIPAPSTVIS